MVNTTRSSTHRIYVPGRILNKALVILSPSGTDYRKIFQCTLSSLHESDSNHYSTRTHTHARQLGSCEPRLGQASPSWLVCGAHTCLGNRGAGCVHFKGKFNDSGGIAIQLQRWIPVMGASCSFSVNLGKLKSSLLTFGRSC